MSLTDGNIIEIDNLSFKYARQNKYILKNLTLNIKDGQWIALIGHNGSGKSTLARLIDGLLKAESGSIKVDGYEMNEKNIWDIRKKIGMVFQNPDNQFVGADVESDIAFGLENQGVPREEMVSRVADALKVVGMEKFATHEPARLSGGQKQRVAIAGILAMEPKVLVLDEPTAGLDPEGRHQMMEMFNRLHKDENLTIILVTHQMNDVAEYADHVIVLESGKVIADSTPKELFSDPEWLKNHHLNLPQTTDFAYKLFDKLALSKHSIPLQSEELTDEILKILGGNLNE